MLVIDLPTCVETTDIIVITVTVSNRQEAADRRCVAEGAIVSTVRRCAVRGGVAQERTNARRVGPDEGTGCGR